jgi:outer membrane protein assembly factor BamA
MRVIFIVAVVIFFTMCFSQESTRVTLFNIETNVVIQKFSIKAKDSIRLSRISSKYIDDLILSGYPLASLDSVTGNFKSGYSGFVYLGPKIKTIEIIPADDQTRAWIKAAPGINEKFLAHVPFTNKDVMLTRRRLLKYLENNGYPFAKLQFESLILSEKLQITLRIVTGPLVKWSKIHIKGNLKLSRNFILTLLEIQEGDLYSEEKFQKAALRLSQIHFIATSQAPQVAFFPEGAELFLYLTKRQASSANGILGMQPDQAGKVVFTGDIQLRLENGLGLGESFQLMWRNLMPQTPQLNVGYNFPFLFRSKFGTDARFHLYKRDSSFLEVRGNFGVRYFLGRNNFVRGFYNFESSNLLSGVLGNPLFSDGMTLRINGYGLGFERQVLDYLPNPREGFKMDFQTLFGTRKTFPTDENSLSQSGTRSNVFRSSLVADYFIPFGKRSTIRLGALAQLYYADTIFANEQIRFGGLQSLRGFNEEALLATTMSRLTLEYRFLLDQNSHILFFFDQGLYENRTRTYVRDAPFGFGAGMSFGTRAGMFSVIYGLGRQFGNPINIRDGKIHVGYFAVF